MSELWVECRAEGGGRETPVRFGAPGAMHRVSEALDAWDGEDHRYFRVRTQDGAIYILRQDLRNGAWRIQFFRDADAR